MRTHRLSRRELLRAGGVGVGVALLLSAVMVPALRLGLSPLPEPLGLAFARQLLGPSVPLPVGLAFHVAYVTLWAVVCVALAYPRLTLVRALGLGLLLWGLALVVFLPVVGWGFLGLALGPEVIPASLVPHLLFVLFLWGLCRLAFRVERGARSA